MKLRLVDDWRSWHRWGSMRLNILATAITAYVLANPAQLVAVFTALPESMRVPFALVAALGLGTLVALARLTRIEKKERPIPAVSSTLTRARFVRSSNGLRMVAPNSTTIATP